jgi:hypothetical protein
VITSLVVKNAVDGFTGSIALDTIDSNGVGFPLNLFSWRPEMDGADIAKMQAPGRWPWRKDVRNMPITIEGTILARTTTEYWTQRKALMAKCFPAPNNTAFDPIKLELVLDGDSNTYYAYCVLDDALGALDVESTHSPTVTKFQLMYSCRAGYWTGPTGLVLI